MEFKKFESINQYSQIIKSVRDYCKRHNKPVGEIEFEGTVKLHGTNFGIGLDVLNNEYITQSRENIITPEKDNCGSSNWFFSKKGDELKKEFEKIIKSYPTAKKIYIYGEFVGNGVQKTTAINKIKDKLFFIFKIYVDDNPIDLNMLIEEQKNNTMNIKERSFFYIGEFKTYKIKIDFNYPENSQNKLIEAALEVEEKCPIAEVFGEIGMGEGVVWKNYQYDLSFKVKGKKHSPTKIKTLKQIAPVDVEKYKKMEDFVDWAVGENRLEQGLSKLTEMNLDNKDIVNLGAYIKWVVNDVFREEGETIKKSEFDNKKIGGLLANKAKNFYINIINKDLNLKKYEHVKMF